MDGFINENDLKNAYKKLYEKLDLDEKPNVGLTLVVTPEWMLAATIEQANQYVSATDENGEPLEENVPIFLDGLAYAGIVKQGDLAVIHDSNKIKSSDDDSCTDDSEDEGEVQQESVLYSLTKQAAGAEKAKEEITTGRLSVMPVQLGMGADGQVRKSVRPSVSLSSG